MDRLVLLVFGALFCQAVVGSKRSKDLFSYDPTLSYVPYSSYVGEVSPFWTFPADGKFKLVDHNEEPRIRTRAAFESAWTRLGQGLVKAQARIDTEEDPEPPRRQEEFISDQEKPRDVPTRPRYGVPGAWARGQMPDKEVDVGFVPIQIYSQTRRFDTEEHLPKERAEEDANNEEERIAAPRLREVLKNSKLHEVYEEEGYEDQGYDHGGYNHHGEKVEDGIKNDNTIYRKFPKAENEGDSDGRGAGIIKVFSQIPASRMEEQIEGATSNTKQVETESPISLTSNDADQMEWVKVQSPPKLQKIINQNAKQNMTIYVPEETKLSERMDIAESRTSSLQSRIVNSPSPRVAFPGRSSKRLYTWDSPTVSDPEDGEVEESVAVVQPHLERYNVHKVASYVPMPYAVHDPRITPVQFSSASPVQFASTINTYASLINQNFSTPLLNVPVHDFTEYHEAPPFTDYVWAQSSVHEQKVPSEQAHRIKFIEEEKTDATTTKSTVPVELHAPTESSRRTTGKQGSRRRGSTRNPSTQNQSTDAHTYSQTVDDTTATPAGPSRQSVTNPPRTQKVYSNFTRGTVKYNPEDESQRPPTVGTNNIRHPSLPFDNGENKEANSGQQNAMKATETPKQSTRTPMLVSMPGRDEMIAIKDPAANARYVEQLTLAHFSVPANLSPHKSHSSEQDDRLTELVKQLNSPENYEGVDKGRKKRNVPIYSKAKYPHYESPPSFSKNSALKYATNPSYVPKKTYGGMEFYDSKEPIRCNGPPQPKNISPKREEDGEWNEEPINDGPRVRGVGKAIDCFKNKFFGRDPFDNPFFKEEMVKTEDDMPTFEKSIPLKEPIEEMSKRRIMVIDHNPIANLTTDIKIAEPVLKPTFSSSKNTPFVTFTTQRPQYGDYGQYKVYEDNREEVATVSPHKYKHYYSLLPAKSQYSVQTNIPQQYTPHTLSVHSIINPDRIPQIRHTSPGLVRNMHKLVPHNGANDFLGRYSPEIYQTPPKRIYPVRPTEYVERKIIIRKRETDNSLWDLINPLKWWWPSLYDSRRREPRFRRSTAEEDYAAIMPSSEEIFQVGSEMVEKMSTGRSSNKPLTLAEFKSRFNISEANKKATTARLTGGFLNRNPDITDVMEILVGVGPTDPDLPKSTVKPKVVFPRAKLPRRKTYGAVPAKKPLNVSEHQTTEATTTTTTTPPPPTTTRMYKPKRLIKKNYGKGPFDAFTVLRTQLEVKATTPQSAESAESNEPKRRYGGEPQMLSSEMTGENETLTYMVNPVTGEGSWSGEQRKWKPKRKRPNTPSVYSYHSSGAKKKKQRAIPDSHPQVYVYGLMSKLLSPDPEETYSSTESGEDNIRQRSSEENYQTYSEEVPATSLKPPPKFILDPDKRRYYYAKVR